MPCESSAGAEPLLDVHAHLMGVGDSGSGLWMAPRYRRSPRWAYVKLLLGLRRGPTPIDRQYVEKLVGFVRASPLEFAAVQAFDGFYDERGELDRSRTDWLVPNDYAFAVGREFPELLPAASVNPARRDWADELEKCAALGARYVKINPCAMGLDPGHAKWRPFYAKMRELKLVLMSHTGPERALTSHGHGLGDPAGLALPLEEGLTVIAAHAGTSALLLDRPDGFAQLLNLMERFERLYADTSAIAQPLRWHWMRRIGESELLRSRLLHGSDFPIAPTAFPWGGLGWKSWRNLRREKNPLSRDLAIKEHFGWGHEPAARAARVLGAGLSGRRTG